MNKRHKVHPHAGGIFIRRLLSGLACNDGVAEFIYVKRCYHLLTALSYPLTSIRRHHGFCASLLVLLYLEQLVQSVDVCPFALVCHHKKCLNMVMIIRIQLLQGVTNHIFLEGHIIDVWTNTAGNGSLWLGTDKLICIRIPRLSLHLYQFDVIAVFLQDIHTHKQIAEAEGGLGDVHLVLHHQFLSACERLLVPHNVLQVAIVRHVAVYLCQFAHLETALSQRL